MTIRFFELDTREVLLTERARSILTLHLAMSALDGSDPPTTRIANSTVNQLTDIRSPHANCTRAFHDLWLTDQVLATEFAGAAADYLDSL